MEGERLSPLAEVQQRAYLGGILGLQGDIGLFFELFDLQNLLGRGAGPGFWRNYLPKVGTFKKAYSFKPAFLGNLEFWELKRVPLAAIGAFGGRIAAVLVNFCLRVDKLRLHPFLDFPIFTLFGFPSGRI